MSSLTLDITGDTAINLLTGSITVVRLNIIAALSSVTLTVSGIADGVIIQFIISNTNILPILVRFDGLDTNLAYVGCSAETPAGSFTTFGRGHTVSVPAGRLTTFIGGLNYDTSGQGNLILGWV